MHLESGNRPGTPTKSGTKSESSTTTSPTPAASQQQSSSEKCKACGLMLGGSGDTAVIQGNEFHLKCFVCTNCKKELKSQLTNGAALCVGGVPYCEQCARSAFVQSQIGISKNTKRPSSINYGQSPLKIQATEAPAVMLTSTLTTDNTSTSTPQKTPAPTTPSVKIPPKTDYKPKPRPASVNLSSIGFSLQKEKEKMKEEELKLQQTKIAGASYCKLCGAGSTASPPCSGTFFFSLFLFSS